MLNDERKEKLNTLKEIVWSVYPKLHEIYDYSGVMDETYKQKERVLLKKEYDDNMPELLALHKVGTQYIETKKYDFLEEKEETNFKRMYSSEVEMLNKLSSDNLAVLFYDKCRNLGEKFYVQMLNGLVAITE